MLIDIKAVLLAARPPLPLLWDWALCSLRSCQSVLRWAAQGAQLMLHAYMTCRRGDQQCGSWVHCKRPCSETSTFPAIFWGAFIFAGMLVLLEFQYRTP